MILKADKVGFLWYISDDKLVGTNVSRAPNQANKSKQNKKLGEIFLIITDKKENEESISQGWLLIQNCHVRYQFQDDLQIY